MIPKIEAYTSIPIVFAFSSIKWRQPMKINLRGMRRKTLSNNATWRLMKLAMEGKLTSLMNEEEEDDT